MPEISIGWELYPLFFMVAFLYSSVGHGGASGYLAIFALFGIVSPAIAPVALLLNVVVASTGWWHFQRSGFFSWRMLLPFVVASIPAAFIGGLILIPRELFSLLLGLALLLAAARIFFLGEVSQDVVPSADTEARRELKRKFWRFGVPMGAGLGFASGLLGIGGGVFLSPILLLLRWADAKRTAAISAAFIVLNSLSGLFGHISRANVDWSNALPLAAVVFAGGFVGSHTGAVRLQPRRLQLVLAVVLMVAGWKLFSKYLFT